MSVLRGQTNFYNYEVTDIVGYNIKSWLDYGLLEKGAYTVVKFDQSTSGYSKLQRIYDTRFGGAGRVYEGMGPSWVWERDLEVPSGYIQPFIPSGIYVNKIFYPSATTTGAYEHYIDFKHGRVIFANSINASLLVECEYVFRDVDIFLADSPQWKTLQDEYWKRFSTLASTSPSGMAATLKQNRLWLPSIAITMDDMTFDKGIQLGGGEIFDYEVRYHVFSDNSFVNKRLCDIINNQNQKTLRLFNINNIVFPYAQNGSLNTNALTYKQLTAISEPSFWTYAYIRDGGGGPRNTPTDVYRGELNHSISIYRHLSTY